MIENEYAFALFGWAKRMLGKKMIICSNYCYIDRDTTSEWPPRSLIIATWYWHGTKKIKKYFHFFILEFVE